MNLQELMNPKLIGLAGASDCGHRSDYMAIQAKTES